MITKEMTLADVVKEYPSTIPYLNEYRLDYCCGGHDPIAQIAKEKNIDLEPFMQELERLAALPKKNNLDYEGGTAAFSFSICTGNAGGFRAQPPCQGKRANGRCRGSFKQNSCGALRTPWRRA